MPSAARSLLFLAASFAAASAVPHDSHDHDHAVNSALPSRWYQDEDHPVHALFRRGNTDGITYPAIGSNGTSRPSVNAYSSFHSSPPPPFQNGPPVSRTRLTQPNSLKRGSTRTTRPRTPARSPPTSPSRHKPMAATPPTVTSIPTARSSVQQRTNAATTPPTSSGTLQMASSPRVSTMDPCRYVSDRRPLGSGRLVSESVFI